MPPNTTAHSRSQDEGISLEESLNRLVEATPYYDMEVPHTSLFEGAYKVVSCIFPEWNYNDIKFVQCKDGITNQREFFYFSVVMDTD